jgi:hypothetical protein
LHRVHDGAVRPHFAFKYMGLLEIAGGGINLEIDLMIFAPIVHSPSHWLCNDLWHLVGLGNCQMTSPGEDELLCA